MGLTRTETCMAGGGGLSSRWSTGTSQDSTMTAERLGDVLGNSLELREATLPDSSSLERLSAQVSSESD
eukprot:CAMPEP_0195098800 /NCGR_PEP_ID=MMETSP0448-20130528/57889_1 /TAXON_ID=66468 /ORGANISM="Heterocapsa triquestra, Strain CCMP 448" /LENGTH=68 /DNA_ID=CAMNT_0040133569 /DNA_START=13 /DNA_END=216 /DNA_ORIENTATION=-